MVESKPRYSRVSDLIDLIILMQSKFQGVTLNDIQQEFGVSRRTAERMRDSILNILPQVEELESNDKCKRWGFRNYSLNALVYFTKEEIATLQKVLKVCDVGSKQNIKKIITKLKALNNKSINTIEEEVDFVLHSEGYAVKQAPKYKLNLENLSIIRQAMKEGYKISATYKSKEKQTDKILSPLGLIYGEKVYLVAREEAKGMGEYNYLLHKLSNLKMTDETFNPKGFNLKKFSEKSFGVYQGKSYNVELKFSPQVKEEVLNYQFHPTQKIITNEDDTTTVKFKACGEMHIFWNLFKWGSDVQIISPATLKTEYKEYVKNVLNSL